MRLIARGLGIALVLASTVLTVAVVCFWYRSYRTQDAWSRVGTDRRFTLIVSEGGSIRWESTAGCPWEPTSWNWMTKRWQGITRIYGTTRPSWEQAIVLDGGLGLIGTDVADFPGPAKPTRVFEIAHAAVLGPLASPSILAFVLHVRQGFRERRSRKRRDRGLCGTCGYDLRFTTDVCPECGRPK